MRIGVISDTHTDSINSLPRKLLDELSGVDLIIHAGDYTTKRLLDDIRGLGNFTGVYGNMDSVEVRKELAAVATIEAGSFKVGVNHPAEGGAPFNMEKRLRQKFQDVQAIIHGHSHQARNDVKEGILYFNPGSATGRFPATKKTYGILNIDNAIKGEIIKIESK